MAHARRVLDAVRGGALVKLPRELVLAKRKREIRKAIRRRGVQAPRLAGAYDVQSRDRRHEELAAIAAKL